MPLRATVDDKVARWAKQAEFDALVASIRRE